MVDLHCHILPGLDDGAKTIEESLAMAESAIADGITHVVATPHSSTEYAFDYTRVRAARDELQSKLGDRLQLATGCDFHLNPENLAALKKSPAQFCLNQKDYLLVEFNEFSIPPAMDQMLHQLQLAGLRPVVTHPERNGILRAKPERLAQWVRVGCYAQVTAGSLLGSFGLGAKSDSISWIMQGLVHFVSSDAHNTKSRPLTLRPAYEFVSSQFGEETAQALFVDNPLAAFEGRTLPFVPEVEDERSEKRRKRFFFF
ncbi:MAG TPA: CpsB/CapC family capsule biosynthesis tyrosine phosphatase [Candidatus Dormibacteraeota bacterium]|nr:CpsB/CapC family capsule biosynthesis tyrosine phosphatase [Candidatus Dormibacteraeota bacterium]